VLTATATPSSISSGRQTSKPGWRPTTGRGVSGRGEGRRHPGQRHRTRRVSLRQPDDRGERHPRGAHRPAWRSLSSSARPASIRSWRRSRSRRRAADRPAGADQRVVCHCQDRRHQAVPGLSEAVWHDDFIAAMPTNLYGPGDNYDLQTSHVLPALMRKVHEAKAAKAPTR
jgi:hypothetical protein